MQRISGPSLVRNGDDGPQNVRDARAQVLTRARSLIALALDRAAASETFAAFERVLIGEVFALARSILLLFLVASEARVRAALTGRVVREGRVFRIAPPQTRNLLSWFGVVRYRRTYLREVVADGQKARGYHPLDAELGLLADRLSPLVLSVAVRLATRVAYSEARDTCGWFLPSVPSTEVIESAVLGYGRYTQEWFEQAPGPEDDGDVLVIMVDGKGVPTATETELAKRRGKRKRRKKTPSPRHRGRLRPLRPRRAPGGHLRTRHEAPAESAPGGRDAARARRYRRPARQPALAGCRSLLPACAGHPAFPSAGCFRHPAFDTLPEPNVAALRGCGKM